MLYVYIYLGLLTLFVLFLIAYSASHQPIEFNGEELEPDNSVNFEQFLDNMPVMSDEEYVHHYGDTNEPSQ